MELEQHASEMLDQHGAGRLVRTIESRAALAIRKPQRRNLVLRDIVGTRNEHLQHSGRPICHRRLRDARLVAVLKRAADGDRPLALEIRDERW
jgi:hypothetical protein